MYVLGAYYSLLNLVLEHLRKVHVFHYYEHYFEGYLHFFSKLFLYMCGYFMKNALLAVHLPDCMVLFSLVIFNYIFIYSVCMWACVYVCTCHQMHVGVREQLQEIHYLHHTGLRDEIWIVSLGSKHLFLLRDLASPILTFHYYDTQGGKP